MADSNTSGFNFLSSSANDASSSFSFINNEEVADSAVGDGQTASGSSFAFLTASDDQAQAVENSGSGFSFLSDAERPADQDLLGSVIETHSSQEIKLGKVAQAKQVRKKKKASRVGFGREDDGDDPDSSTQQQDLPVLPPQLPPQSVPPPPVGPAPPLPLTVTQAVEEAPTVAETSTIATVAGGSDVSDAGTSQLQGNVSASQAAPAKRSSFLGWLGVRSEPTSTTTAAAPQQPSTTPQPVPQPVPQPAPQTTPPAALTSPPKVPSVPPSYIPDPPVQVEDAHPTEPTNRVLPNTIDPSISNVDLRPAAMMPPTTLPISQATVVSENRSKSASPSDAVEQVVLQLFDKNATLVSNFQLRVEQLCKAQRAHSAKLNEIKATLLSHKANSVKTRLRISELESEQARLANIEAFEEAAEVGTRMEQLKAEMETKQAEVAKIAEQEALEIAALTGHRAEVCDVLEEFMDAMRQLREERQPQSEVLQRESESELGGVEERLTAEEERLATELRHLQREEDTVSEESTAIENSIASQSGRLIEEKEEMNMRLLGLNGEIAQLEATLQQKRAEAKDVSRQLDNIEDKLGDVRKKYDRQLQRIGDRRNALSKALAEREKEEKLFFQQREVYDRHRSRLTDAIRRVKTWAQSVDAETANADLAKLTLGKSHLDAMILRPLGLAAVGGNGDDSGIASVADGNCSEDAVLADAVVSADVSLAGFIQTRASIAAKRSSLQREMSDVELRIPVLESEKKDHALNKRYKEAAQVAKDIKALMNRKEEIDAELIIADDSLNKTNEAIAEEERRLKAAQDALKKANAAGIADKYRSYRTRIGQLRNAIDRIRAEDPLCDDCSGFRVAVLSLLGNELDELTSVADAMKIEYSLPELVDQVVDQQEVEGDEIQPAAPISDTADDATQSSANGVEINGLRDATIDAAASNEEDIEDENVRQEKILKVRALINEKEELSRQRDASAEAEDYEAAAELEDQITNVGSEIEGLLQVLKCSLQEVV